MFWDVLQPILLASEFRESDWEAVLSRILTAPVPRVPRVPAAAAAVGDKLNVASANDAGGGDLSDRPDAGGISPLLRRIDFDQFEALLEAVLEEAGFDDTETSKAKSVRD
jgi:hypothetical protein